VKELRAFSLLCAQPVFLSRWLPEWCHPSWSCPRCVCAGRRECVPSVSRSLPGAGALSPPPHAPASRTGATATAWEAHGLDKERADRSFTGLTFHESWG